MKRKRIFFASVLLGLSLLAGAFALDSGEEYIVSGISGNFSAPNGYSRVFYEIFTGSFSDSDGDGIGDLRGIINRLDYLNDGDPLSGKSLGVGGIWLTPVFESPTYHKYDITDYYRIDPAFGTMEDLRELIEKCHERGMLVILDLPINHTGNQNSWFIQFRNAHLMHNSGNRYYDLYSWLPEGSPMPAGRHFTRIPGAEGYYECNFSDNMPELNYDLPQVRQMMLDVALYYLDLGADGFRFDAAKYIYYGDHRKTADFWEWYIGELKKVKPDVFTVAEVWDGDGITDQYQKATPCFDFTVAQSTGLIASTARQGNVNRYTQYVRDYLERTQSLSGQASYVPFLANHDTDRAAGYLTVAAGHAQIAANLYILGPGSPFIYYGEEIGLRGSRGGGSTDANRRLAMLWGDGDTVKDPVGSTYEAKKQTPYTVRDLIGNEDSLLTYYKRLLLIRAACPEIALGTYRPIELNGKAGGFTSSLNENSVTVIHNTTLNTVTVDLSTVEGACSRQLFAFIGMGGATLENGVLSLDSHTSAVIR